MHKHFWVVFYSLILTGLGLAAFASGLYADKIGKYSPNPEMIDKGMTLWQLIVAGGSCMIFIGLLSVAGAAIIIYHFMHVRPDRLVPQDFVETLLSLLEKSEIEKAHNLCKQQPSLISEIIGAGLKKVSQGKAVVEEVIVHEGKIRIEKLWQNLSYLGDIAVIAPMIGLLGTVLGMIQAFNFVAFQAGIVKPVLLANGLAKAMITTAFGLIVAIPIMAFYAYLRGWISTITTTTERVASESIQLIGKSK